MKYFLIIFSLAVLVSINHADAAQFFLETKENEVGLGQRMEVVVRLNSEGETINAIEGIIRVPNSLLIETIRDGNSLISFWTERPNTEAGQNIKFSGIVPGGWKGSSGEIFSIIVKTEVEGDTNIRLSDMRALLHDGEGTEAVTKVTSLVLQVDKSIPNIDLITEVEDNEPPESFTPILARDPNIFSDDYFLAFATQDKGSGINRYEALETREKLNNEELGEWEVIESPYRINDQGLKSFIYIRAIDNQDNVRVAVFDPLEKPLFSLKNIILIVIIITVLIVVYLYLKNRKRKIINEKKI